MLIKELELKEFRGIKALKEPIRFSRFNILIGRNNSGKSSILDALFLIPRSIIPEPYRDYAKSRGDFLSQYYGDVKFLIYGYSGKAEVKYVLANNEELRVEVFDNGRIIDYAPQEKGVLDYLKKAFRENVENISILFKNESKLQRILTEWMFNKWDRIVKSGLNVDIVKNIVNPCIDEEFTELLIYKDDLRVRKEINEKVLYVRLRDLGSGIYGTIILAIILGLLKPNLVLIDDFDVAKHPTLIEALLKWFDKGDWQIVISTHSLDVLYGVLEASPKDFQLIQLRKTHDDILHYRILTFDELEDLIESNVDPRKLVDIIKI